jgi:pyruvate dehydrogenase E1 component
LGSGTILNEVIKAQKMLEEDYNVSTDVWSVTSYKNLHTNALEVERWNMMNPTKKAKIPYISELTNNESGVFVAASDYVQILKDSVAKYLPGKLTTLGTYGFGRSEGRSQLRDFFEVDAKHIAYATLYSLYKEKKIKAEVINKAIKDLGIDTKKPNPWTV